jgi:hypothetical protein
VVALKVTDVDSERMTLRIEQGKGRRDGFVAIRKASQTTSYVVRNTYPTNE